MSGILVFDTETTDRWQFKLPWDHDDQPHIVQLAWVRDDAEGNTVEEQNLILQLPEGVECSPEAAKVHGISQLRINEEGIPRSEALDAFARACKQASVLVAHNYDFDSKVLAAAYNREGRKFTPNCYTYCTMKNLTNYLRLPGRYSYKWPRLDEAYRMLIDVNGFEGAHDALADVKACRAVYYEALRRNL